MKVLIIGGTRFVGRHLVAKLLKAGHQVTLFNRGQHPVPTWFAGVQVIKGDRNNADDLAQLRGQRFDVVIDMVLYDGKQAAQAVEVLGGEISQYLMISTGSVYKMHAGPVPFRETDAVENDPKNEYGYNKAQAEQVLLQAWQESKFPASILRLPSVYGPYDYQAREWYFIKRLLDGRRRFLLPDGGMGVFHREYAGNIADQLILLMQKPESIGEIYNSGHQHFQTCRALLEMAAKQLEVDIELYTLPQGAMPWSIVLSPPLTYCQTTDKLAALGYREQYNLETGWAETVNFFREYPVKDWLFQQRSAVDLFNYQEEDRVIDEAAVRIR